MVADVISGHKFFKYNLTLGVITLCQSICLGVLRTSAKDNHYTLLNKTFNQHLFGRFAIPTQFCLSPEEAYRARVKDIAGVEAQKQSQLRFQTISTHGVCVAFWPAAQELPKKNTFDFTDPGTFQVCRDNGFYFIIGDHTITAAKKLHAKYPKNKKWMSVLAQLLIMKRSRSNYNFLKSWGTLDNVKGEIRTTVTFVQRMLSLHEDWERVSEEFKDSAAGLKAAIIKLKAARQLDHNMNKNTFGQLWSLAARGEPVWPIFVKLLHGDVVRPDSYKVPKSSSWFNKLGKIPEEDVAVLLQRCVEREIELKDLPAACVHYKAKARVQSAILDHSEINLKDWTDAESKFPFATDGSFVDQWTHVIVRQKIRPSAPLPIAFANALDNRVESDLKISDNETKINLQVTFIIL